MASLWLQAFRDLTQQEPWVSAGALQVKGGWRMVAAAIVHRCQDPGPEHVCMFHPWDLIQFGKSFFLCLSAMVVHHIPTYRVNRLQLRPILFFFPWICNVLKPPARTQGLWTLLTCL